MTLAIPCPYIEELPDAGELVRVTVLRDATPTETANKFDTSTASELELYLLRKGQQFVGRVRDTYELGFTLEMGSRLIWFEAFAPVAVATINVTPAITA